MSEDRVRSILIVGGGAAGWLAASALARRLDPAFCIVCLIENPPRRPAAISEVALPTFHRLNRFLGINENDLMQHTQATFRLGTQFVDWDCVGNQYFHTFGPIGVRLGTAPFHHCWLKLRRGGVNTHLAEYSVSATAALQGRFARPDPELRPGLSLDSYGFHFQADTLAVYLRQYAQAHGVTRIDRKVVDVQLRGEDGFIKALQLDDGVCVNADLYIDCNSDLAQRVIAGGQVDWSHWLPCDRAVAISCTTTDAAAPHSKARARIDGWQWEIPLQGSVDTGYAYSSRLVSDDEATAALVADLPGSSIEAPRHLSLTTGRPAKFWDKNCLTLPCRTLEPLESTGLHLVQTAIMRLLSLFPVRRFSSHDIEEYNRLTELEHDRIRDFLILHYKATTRADSRFWEHCRDLEVPATLRARIELFQRCARISLLDDEHFGADSWLAVLMGQGIEPQDYDPLVDVLDVNEMRGALDQLRSLISQGVDRLPLHSRFIEAHCRARMPA